ncbi:coenzyme F420-dependent N5,N10-methylene tetrahydromethanopterin reductase [Aliidongia dinghuensis]|uniref:Coenzyme F420-dependent N5,N10-methylene tetrahydromethanopterin reductase n=1 Tax=Aliidongia dinghuensis TaxID=1867774 RepID=A0A8J2YPI3_9PROT|nr:coenzyme F420-dependent N5,N10-methylene tetrahydromethanopterin reductase [Aliidongia dinghuensis]
MGLAALAEELGFSAVWVRDVPLNGPWYPEAFGHPDPIAMLGAIAARTFRIVIGTAATVLTLRHPLHLAKAAITLDRLSGGRFVLGLGSGDRREEFSAFGADSGDHKDLYRDHWMRLAAALEQPPRILPPPAEPAVAFELRPAAATEIPMLAVGSGGQTLEWIARNATGWATYHRPPEIQRDRYALWRRAVDRVAPGAFRSFSVAVRVELVEAPSAPAAPIDLGYRTGIRGLATVLEAMRDAGVHHALLNLPPTGARPAETVAALATILPALD